ncbi:MAG: PDZ domain-containing protein, partial [Thermoanaerobaculia bacterium]
ALGLAGCSANFLAGFGVGIPQELQQTGVLARAEILEIWDTGWSVNDNPVIGMKVRVLPAGAPSFEARIEKTAVSRIAVSQFQPGNVVAVRYDEKDPTQIAVDPDADPSQLAAAGSAPAGAASGNPFRDQFAGTTLLGATPLCATAAPELYLGTGDSAADNLALVENGYVPLGFARVAGGRDAGLALAAGAEIGAAIVVVYGHFAPPDGRALELLPLRPRTSAAAGAGAAATGYGLGPGEQLAAYWSRTRPTILGIVSRPLSEEEMAGLGRQAGIVVEGVANGSPAEAAQLAVGDVLVAIAGQPIVDVRATPALIASFAGQSVRIDLLRDGQPLAVTAQLNPAP